MTEFTPGTMPEPMPDEQQPASWEAELTIPFSMIPAIPASYLWPGVIPNRTPVFFVAPGGTGKGLAIAAIAAMATTGAAFPGEKQGRAPGQVITISPEDDANEDMAFRLRAAGADMSLVRDLTLLPSGAPFLLPANIPELHQAITEADAKGPPVLLVTLDPLDALAENGLSSQRAARAIMQPLHDLCRDYGGAMILSHHTTKNSDVVAGSQVLTDSARMVWMIGTAKDDANVRVMAPWKSNRPTAGTMRFQITGEGNDVHAVFTGPDAGPESQAPSSRAARLRLAVEEEIARPRWADAHPPAPEPAPAEPALEPAAPAEPPTVPEMERPTIPEMEQPTLPEIPPASADDGTRAMPVIPDAPGGNGTAAYLRKYISEGEPAEVRKIANALLNEVTEGGGSE